MDYTYEIGHPQRVIFNLVPSACQQQYGNAKLRQQQNQGH